MTEHCDELKGRLRVLQEQAVELDRRISGIALKMGHFADRASDDDIFDRMYDQLNVADEELEQVRAQIVKIEVVMRERGCI
jgi:hypothetical protein